jgi:tRNA U38,U39,U40 pseudouridine synthase TruA
MHFNDFSFGELTKDQYIAIREFIREHLLAPEEEARKKILSWAAKQKTHNARWYVSSRYLRTAFHQFYNKLRGKENCHELKKAHHCKGTMSRTLERCWVYLQSACLEKNNVCV